MWVDDMPVDDGYLIYIHDVTTENVLEVQIESKRSADVLLSAINLIYVQYLESQLKALDYHV